MPRECASYVPQPWCAPVFCNDARRLSALPCRVCLYSAAVARPMQLAAGAALPAMACARRRGRHAVRRALFALVALALQHCATAAAPGPGPLPQQSGLPRTVNVCVTLKPPFVMLRAWQGLSLSQLSSAPAFTDPYSISGIALTPSNSSSRCEQQHHIATLLRLQVLPCAGDSCPLQQGGPCVVRYSVDSAPAWQRRSALFPLLFIRYLGERSSAAVSQRACWERGWR